MAKAILLAAILGCLLPKLVRADILFDNGNHVQTGSLADSFDNYHETDDFVLPSSAAITQITWKGYYLSISPVDDNFEVLIYADNGSGGPTSPVTASAIYSVTPSVTDRHLTGEMPFGVEQVYQYSGNIPAFNAVGGTRYWLEIFNDLSNNDWLWSADTQAGNGFFSHNGSDWAPDNNNMTAFTFQVVGTAVPEPSTIALLALGSLGLLARRRFTAI